MEIRELQWFVALAESEHVTAAAERLNITQPTLSRAIARLEKRVGVPLFDRRQNRLRLNKYGEVFRAHVVRAISEIDRAEQRIATLVDPDTGTITLGFLHSYGTWLIPELLAGYRTIAPATTFELRGSAADVVVDGVRRGRLDLGVTSPRPVGDDLQWSPLRDEPLGLLVPVGHPLASRSRVETAELTAEEFVALQPEYGLRQVTDRLCERAGFAPRIVLECTELSTLRTLVTSGLGVAVVPSTGDLAAYEGRAVHVPLADPQAYRTIGVIVAAGGPRAAVVARFHDYVRSTARPRG
ncbi:LysR family transcriptional regulator [Streptomyces sp. BE20]|uniref:LysR family transcriptional regulator n=1 Tax=unclassified Streptomyces TaxID=2593676 RepID=UPI002E78842A|nr:MULTISPECIES: LysR family transcriptional regulator [unclassified Streptomyces]MED7948849.1 LysR family transcriptional regulator [Streptomyces sp. BE303]MEE1822959.1 LysR family transcriptional regulator [Streptomyces sp. BE20]